MPLIQALKVAREGGADLVEVAPVAVPPVCRLLDYGKFKYEQAKKERDSRKSQKSIVLRQVRMRPQTNEHDVGIKTRRIRELLDEGDKVKVSVIFRGREVTHPHIGRELLEKVSQTLQETASVEKSTAMEGRIMSIIFSPAKQSKAVKES